MTALSVESAVMADGKKKKRRIIIDLKAAKKIKMQAESSSSNVPENCNSIPKVGIEFNEAFFFVDYSIFFEDILRSIRDNFWSSSEAGNEKFHAAFMAARKVSLYRKRKCPIFLLITVPYSGKFHGVAKMCGPLDFYKSIKWHGVKNWRGSFSVIWHTIKDIPANAFSGFRNVYLQPLADSRHATAVEFTQGIAILSIFKRYQTKNSMLQHMKFYEKQEGKKEEECQRTIIAYFNRQYLGPHVYPQGPIWPCAPMYPQVPLRLQTCMYPEAHANGVAPAPAMLENRANNGVAPASAIPENGANGGSPAPLSIPENGINGLAPASAIPENEANGVPPTPVIPENGAHHF